MTKAGAMLETYPADLGGVDRKTLTECIRSDLDCIDIYCADIYCADICGATGRILSRHTDYDANLTRAVLEACAQVCQSCGDECARHAEMGMRHCEVCAEACRRCEQACRQLLTSL